MTTKIKLLGILFLSIFLFFSSCKKELGCMDPTSLTYNTEAQEDDGSCVYAYDIALGVWDIVPDCEEIDVLGQTISLSDQLPDSIEVQGAGDNSLFIDVAGTQISGDISYDGIITVSPQTAQVDLGIPLDIQVEGTGKINLNNTGEMYLTYSFDIPLVGSQSISCDISLTK